MASDRLALDPVAASGDPMQRLIARVAELEQQVNRLNATRTTLPSNPQVARAQGFGSYNTPTDFSTVYPSKGGLVVVFASTMALVNATTFAAGAELRIDGVVRDTQTIQGSSGSARLAVPLCTYSFSGSRGDHTIAIRGTTATQRLDYPTILVVEMPLFAT